LVAFGVPRFRAKGSGPGRLAGRRLCILERPPVFVSLQRLAAAVLFLAGVLVITSCTS